MGNPLLMRRAALVVYSVALLGAAPAARAETIYGITSSDAAPQTLVRCDSATPGVVTIGPLSGMAAGQVAIAIDFRPATGQLFLGVGEESAPGPGGQVYTVNLGSGALTPVTPAFDLAGLGIISFDFNPVVDQLRVLTIASDARGPINSRFDPVTGTLVTFDLNPAFAAGDVNVASNPPNVIGIAYTNNVAGAPATTLYAYEIKTGDLATIGGVGGTPSPNGGRLFTVGDSGVVVPGSADAFGFDISGPTGIAYVSTLTEELPGFRLFTVSLATGALTDVGAIGLPSGVNLLDISVAVPEPASLGLVTIAIMGLLSRRRW